MWTRAVKTALTSSPTNRRTAAFAAFGTASSAATTPPRHRGPPVPPSTPTPRRGAAPLRAPRCDEGWPPPLLPMPRGAGGLVVSAAGSGRRGVLLRQQPDHPKIEILRCSISGILAPSTGRQRVSTLSKRLLYVLRCRPVRNSRSIGALGRSQGDMSAP